MADISVLINQYFYADMQRWSSAGLSEAGRLEWSFCWAVTEGAVLAEKWIAAIVALLGV